MEATTLLDNRMHTVERDIAEVKQQISSEIRLVRIDFESVIEKHSSILERVADKIETALQFQRDSLPIGLVMKLFSFFAVLITTLFGAILGIKHFVGGADSSQLLLDTIKQLDRISEERTVEVIKKKSITEQMNDLRKQQGLDRKPEGDNANDSGGEPEEHLSGDGDSGDTVPGNVEGKKGKGKNKP